MGREVIRVAAETTTREVVQAAARVETIREDVQVQARAADVQVAVKVATQAVVDPAEARVVREARVVVVPAVALAAPAVDLVQSAGQREEDGGEIIFPDSETHAGRMQRAFDSHGLTGTGTE